MDIKTTLLKIAEQEGLIDCSTDDLKDGDSHGYLGDINIVNINGKTKNGEKTQLSVLIKCAATNEKLRENGIVGIYEREIRMYTSIFPAYYDFEKEKGIKIPFPLTPRCYGAFTNCNPEILILENLSTLGYQSWNKKLQMQDSHVRVALKEYGRYHALGFVIQDQNPTLFKKLTDNFDNSFEIFMKRGGMFYSFIQKIQLALNAIDSSSNVFRRYEEFLNGIEQKFTDVLAKDDKYNSILHGDSWCNNMMFKYNQENQPVDIRFIDFQLSRVGPPICDLAYFLYGCTSKEVLDNMNTYKAFYYENLSKHIKLLGSNPDSVYPPSAFEEQWKKYAKFGLMTSGLINFALLSEKHEVIDFNEVAAAGHNIGTAFDYEIANMKEFNIRMTRIIENFVANDLL
ncbi:hypothetical protein ILUMI_19441 [Ignelater luminosus]|uniref:CHK kinase-like domain-containing protein n=1 Tax=Ignelater luminosus TaxID=2038154 RepID=A0A8K0CME7_IGNLU|nr:hypothetical protein ILUMI_19441 [Ignelater luminosus]